MSAAGLSDVYRYGVRFVGYLIAVTFVGGIFVVGGVGLGGTVLVSAVGSGGVASVASGTVVAAVALVSIGALLLLTGIVGLLYKLVADAAMTGVVKGQAAWMADSETEARAAGADEGSAAGQGRESPNADGTTAATAVAGAADNATDTDVTEPATDRPEDVAVTPDGDADAAAGSVGAVPDDATAADSSPEPATDAQTVIGEPDAPADGPAEDDSVAVSDSPTDDSVAVSDSPTDDDSGTEPDPTDVNALADESAAGASGNDSTTQTPERDADPAATRPEEWSPPDPSEFQTVDSATSGPTEESASGDETAEWETRESDGESTDGPRTADDLFGGDTDDGGEEIEDISSLLSADDEDPVDTDEPVDPSEDGATGDGPDDDSRTETNADSDPLSDALDDS